MRGVFVQGLPSLRILRRHRERVPGYGEECADKQREEAESNTGAYPGVCHSPDCADDIRRNGTQLYLDDGYEV